MLKIIVSITILSIVASVADASDRKARARGEGAWAWATAKAAPTPTEQPAKPTAATAECTDALAEVNAERAKRGLAPFQHDPLLTQAAYSCAKERAAKRIHEHVDDFAHLPAGISPNGIVAGCGALEDSWGFRTCCWDENYTYAGAAWVRGSDNLRYMHLFVSNQPTLNRGSATLKTEGVTLNETPNSSTRSASAAGSCASGSCGTSTRERRGLFSRR